MVETSPVGISYPRLPYRKFVYKSDFIAVDGHSDSPTTLKYVLFAACQERFPRMPPRRIGVPTEGTSLFFCPAASY